MSFTPPKAYRDAAERALLKSGDELWYDVAWWSPPMRWIDYDPERLKKHVPAQPIVDYIMFAQTGGGDPWCWHSGIPTQGDEFEIHEVDLFMYIPRAPTFEKFVLRTHLQGLVHCEDLEFLDDCIAPDMPLLRSVLSPHYLELVAELERRIRVAFASSAPNPFSWNECTTIIRRELGDRYIES
jgi:hypothetical protein